MIDVGYNTPEVTPIQAINCDINDYFTGPIGVYNVATHRGDMILDPIVEQVSISILIVYLSNWAIISMLNVLCMIGNKTDFVHVELWGKLGRELVVRLDNNVDIIIMLVDIKYEEF